MPTLTDTLILRTSAMSVYQGQYDLTAAAMQSRGNRPLVCGDTYTLQFTLTTSAGVAVDLTAATIAFNARYKASDSAPFLTKSATVTTPTSGIFTVSIAATDVTGPGAVWGVYDIQKTQSGDVQTLLSGNIEFLPNITR